MHGQLEMRKLKVVKLNGCVKMERTNDTFYRFKPLPHQLDRAMKYSLLTSTKLWALVAGHGQYEWSQGVRPSGLAFDISFAGRHKSRKYVFRTRKGHLWRFWSLIYSLSEL